ncbi:MAG: RdgB/HAM1 family non-canonical purine NTP pyrophosphatase [Muribaculaceae bacterium]|nr:RdgB/HAM1 family non-canonical purine NTP pyrophosphatase [Muribaculaceae bacterium]
MRKIVFATNNEHKLKEVREILNGRMQVLSLNDIDCHEDIPETADTIKGNAEMKARYVMEHYGYDCFSDDTGLEIDALNGEPGVMSARYSGGGSEANIDKVLKLMHDVPTDKRTARFRTVIALIEKEEDDTTDLLRRENLRFFNGKVEGMILTERHGEGGFGYDSIFAPIEGDGRTFGEMLPAEKNAISHRARAVAQLIKALTEE